MAQLDRQFVGYIRVSSEDQAEHGVSIEAQRDKVRAFAMANDLPLVRIVEDAGVSAIVYTDIGRDGMLGGLNLEQTVALAERLTTPVIASGGVGSLDDLKALKTAAVGTRIEGVIVGRALYDGRVDPAEALTLFSL